MMRSSAFVNRCRLGRLSGGMAILLSASSLAGCAAVDHFGDRAVDYNHETAGSKGTSVLINIMRAAYGVPLQFTDVTTVSGQGMVGASIGSSVPVAAFPALTPQLSSITPGLSASANSTFNVANLNTQEFYNGLQAPVSTQLIGAYLNGGFDPAVLLQILISDIEVDAGGRKTIIHNGGGSFDSFSTFYSAVALLVNNGLSVEASQEPDSIGPILTSAQAADPKVLSAMITTMGTDAPDIKMVSKDRFQLKKKSGGYRFCFDPLKRTADLSPPYAASPDLTSIDARLSGRTMHLVLLHGNMQPVPGVSFDVDSAHLCGSKVKRAGPADTPGRAKAGLNFSFRSRSTEGVILYLGALVRTQLGLGSSSPQSLAVPGADNRTFYDVFRVNRGSSGPDTIGFSYRGSPYNILLDPSGRSDTSSRVVQLVTELLALQSSAKNLPAPNLISVISP